MFRTDMSLAPEPLYCVLYWSVYSTRAVVLCFILIWNYCLSNAMHGQNIHSPVCVCVCVCVSVTLSVKLPTGQTPQRIFTVDSLTDADLCKDVFFGGLDDEFRGPKSPKTPILGAQIGISSQICEKFK